MRSKIDITLIFIIYLASGTAHLVAEREFILTLHLGKEVWYVIRLP